MAVLSYRKLQCPQQQRRPHAYRKLQRQQLAPQILAYKKLQPDQPISILALVRQ